jgi:redox-sensitive bicupin YhaK (pirin superfamily)
MSLAVTSLMAWPAIASSKPEEDMETPETVQRIRPLGFQWETSDPFLFCVHHDDKFPEGNDEMGPNASLEGRHIGQDFIIKDGWRMYHGDRIPGFPGHPHRGFETITVVRRGMVDHADSMGAAGRYGNGDVQWMTAGGGVQHSEMFPLMNKDKGNPLELFQIWLNLPRKSKMVKPHFTMFWADDIPVLKFRDGNNVITEVEVLAGEFAAKSAPAPPPDSWAADKNNHVSVLNIRIEANGEFRIPPTESGINRTLYFYQGNDLSIDSKSIPEYHAVDLQPENEVRMKAGNHECRVFNASG